MQQILLVAHPRRSEGIHCPNSNTEEKYDNPTRLGTRIAVSL